MPDFIWKSFDRPEETIEFPGVVAHVVELGDLTVARLVNAPGWRWSAHMKPTVGGEWCQARHIGVILSGCLGIELSDGTTMEFRANDVFDVPPGHDGFTVGDEPCVQIEWTGIRAWAGFPTGIHSRVLRTLLFTDLVDSTQIASRLGDARWRELLDSYYAAVLRELTAFRGREVDRAGDGLLATFDGPARAIRCACSVRDRLRPLGLSVRIGLHTGECELAGDRVGGIAVHIGARVAAKAGADEVLVSSTVKDLVAGSGLKFADHGVHVLKGVPDEWRLYSVE